MKRYDVYVYNTKEHFHDKYRVLAEDPVDARNVAVQRLIDETGDGLNANEINEVKKISDEDE
jgi:hypothetical protein